MVLEKIFGKREIEDDIGKAEYIEVNSEASDQPSKMPIRVESLTDFSDTDRIQKYLREGAIVLLKIGSLRSKDLGELKRSVDKLRRTCSAISGDIAGVEDNLLILTPQFAKVHRG